MTEYNEHIFFCVNISQNFPIWIFPHKQKPQNHFHIHKNLCYKKSLLCDSYYIMSMYFF